MPISTKIENDASHKDLLACLRMATHRAHENLHVHPALRNLTLDQLTFDYYQSVLKKFYGFHAPLERALVSANFLEIHDFTSFKVSELLKQDLFRWHIDQDSLPMIAAVDPFSVEQAVGYLYLREGSALGGQLIARHLQTHFGYSPGQDIFFFSGDGSHTGAVWKKFRDLLAHLQIDAEAASQYSAELFGQLDDWLLKTH